MCLRDRVQAADNGDTAAVALAQAVDQLDTLVGDLQRVVMKARMQPVGRMFQKFVRLERDLARSCGKDVELVLVGEETEVDKTILDELNDPLVHLVRNAVDHGIESPAERAAAGKPARSQVRLAARQGSDHIVIAITDDGRGMRPEVIRTKAVEKGPIGADEAALLDDRQSLALIFLPGCCCRPQSARSSSSPRRRCCSLSSRPLPRSASRSSRSASRSHRRSSLRVT